MNNRIKIVYMVGGPLTERWLSCYCLDQLAEKLDVEYWDCSDVIISPYEAKTVLERPYVHHLTENNLSANLQRCCDAIYIQEIVFEKWKPHLCSLLLKYVQYGIHINICSYTPIELFESQQDLRNQGDIWHKMKSGLYENIAIKIIGKLFRYGLTSRYVEIVKKTIRSHRYNKERNRYYALFRQYTIAPMNVHSKYHINHPDYEKYLHTKGSCPIEGERYIVFVGQFFPYHADLVSDIHAEIDVLAQQYYASLNCFFGKLEKKYNCKVVIAEHPSANHVVNPYEDRIVLYGKTAELIRGSIGVVMHYSNSFSFVALNDKPMAVIETSAMKGVGPFSANTHIFADTLQFDVINVDAFDEETNILVPIRRDLLSKYVSMMSVEGNADNGVLYYEHFKDLVKRFRISN